MSDLKPMKEEQSTEENEVATTPSEAISAPMTDLQAQLRSYFGFEHFQ